MKENNEKRGASVEGGRRTGVQARWGSSARGGCALLFPGPAIKKLGVRVRCA